MSTGFFFGSRADLDFFVTMTPAENAFTGYPHVLRNQEPKFDQLNQRQNPQLATRRKCFPDSDPASDYWSRPEPRFQPSKRAGKGSADWTLRIVKRLPVAPSPCET
jgi:hypothetical protein